MKLETINGCLVNAEDGVIVGKLHQWNTLNGYTEHGQRIGAVVLEDGGIIFADIDRQIDGFIPGSYRPGEPLQRRVMCGYMHTEVEYWCTGAAFDNDYLLYEMKEAARTAARYAPSVKHHSAF